MADKDDHLESMMETTVKSDTIYDGKILTLKVNTVELPNMKYAKREIALHARGVGIIALTNRGTMYMVRQYRAGVGEVLLEIPAGLVDPGESPQEAAVRELQEEIKRQPESLVYLLDAYSSPGFTNEKLSLFLARGLNYSPKDLDSTEFLEVEEFPVEDLFEMVKNFDIVDAKSIIAIQYAYYECYLPNREEFLKHREGMSAQRDDDNL